MHYYWIEVPPVCSAYQASYKTFILQYLMRCAADNGVFSFLSNCDEDYIDSTNPSHVVVPNPSHIKNATF